MKALWMNQTRHLGQPHRPDKRVLRLRKNVEPSNVGRLTTKVPNERKKV